MKLGDGGGTVLNRMTRYEDESFEQWLEGGRGECQVNMWGRAFHSGNIGAKFPRLGCTRKCKEQLKANMARVE